jgi:hypothetical protein
VSEAYLLDLRMVILDALVDDFEDLSSIMQSAAIWREYWPRDFTEQEVIATLKTLLEAQLIEAYAEAPSSTGPELIRVEVPQAHEDAIRHYWFLPTKAGRDTWQQWDAPPLTDA